MDICTDYKSENFDKRAAGCVPELIIIHCTELDFEQSLAALTQNSGRPVSSHFLIDTDGKIYQLVDVAYRAWHAGVCYWQGRNALNAHSIGIEIVNPGHLRPDNKYAYMQMKAVRDLCLMLQNQFNIHKSNVLAHSDIAPQRKTDPGSHFDWQFLFEHGVGIYPVNVLESADFVDCDILSFQQKLSEFGYQINLTGQMDFETINVIEAFKMHFTKGINYSNQQFCQMLSSLISQQPVKSL